MGQSREAQACLAFLGDLRHLRKVRQRLFTLAEQHPHKVQQFMKQLDPEQIHGNEILWRLGKIVGRASEGSRKFR